MDVKQICGCLIGQALAEGWEAAAVGPQDQSAGKWKACRCLALELYSAAQLYPNLVVKLLGLALAGSDQLQDLTFVGQCPLHCPLSLGLTQIPAHHP